MSVVKNELNWIFTEMGVFLCVRCTEQYAAIKRSIMKFWQSQFES